MLLLLLYYYIYTCNGKTYGEKGYPNFGPPNRHPKLGASNVDIHPIKIYRSSRSFTTHVPIGNCEPRLMLIADWTPATPLTWNFLRTPGHPAVSMTGQLLYSRTSTHEGVTAKMNISWRKTGIEAAKNCKNGDSIPCSAMWECSPSECDSITMWDRNQQKRIFNKQKWWFCTQHVWCNVV